MQSNEIIVPVVDVPAIVAPEVSQHGPHTETRTRIGLSASFMGNSARFFFARDTSDDDSKAQSNTSCCSYFRSSNQNNGR